MSQPIQSFIRTRRLAALVTIGLLASGCQVIAPSQWEDRAVLPALPVTYLEVPRTEMVAICADHSGQRLLGCAKRDYAKRACTIVTGSNPNLALLFKKNGASTFSLPEQSTLFGAAARVSWAVIPVRAPGTTRPST